MRRISSIPIISIVAAVALLAVPILSGNIFPNGGETAEAFFGTVKSCYPDNQFSYLDHAATSNVGPAFKSFSGGTARFWESELESEFFGDPNDEFSTDFLGGKMWWSFFQQMDEDSGVMDAPYNGNFGGYIVNKIRWDNGKWTTFKSRCLIEVQTIYDCTNQNAPCRVEVELEAEGWVKGFPDYPGKRPATAKMALKREDGTKDIRVQLGLNLGTTCDEESFTNSPFNNQVELGIVAGIVQSETPGAPEADGFAGKQETGLAFGLFKSPSSTAGAYANSPICATAAATSLRFNPDEQDNDRIDVDVNE